MKIKTWRKRIPLIITIAVFIIFALLIFVMNARYPISYTIYNTTSIFYEKGTVVTVLSEQLEDADGMPGRKLGSQTVSVLMKEGALKGQEIQIENNLSYDHNILAKEGQSVIVKADRPEGVSPFYSLYNYDRTMGIVVVALILIAFMALVGRIKGLRSVLGIAISLFFIIGFLLPTISHGLSPVLMAIITATVIAAFSFLLLNGFSQKTLIALTSSVAGALLSALLFFLITAILSLSGYNMEGVENLILISRGTGLQIGQVLFAGVLIASLGAVMDVAISIASSQYEVKRINPDISKREWFRSGIAVGQDMIGTMCQTLILAFVGSAISTLLVLISYGTQFDQFMSSDYVAVEIVHGITGSLAVIAAVPITAGLCVLLGSKSTKVKETSNRKVKG